MFDKLRISIYISVIQITENMKYDPILTLLLRRSNNAQVIVNIDTEICYNIS